MARAICHELNEPTTTVAGYLELLLMDIPKDNPLHGNIEAIIGEVERMAEITRKLMKVRKYETKADLGGEDRIIDIDKASRCTADDF